MARSCPRCGAQNPDAAERCQSCGGSLISVAAALTSPAGYPSPSYMPNAPAPTAPVHRMQWTFIVSAVTLGVMLAAAGGTAIALIGSHTGGSMSFPGIAGAAPTPSPSPSPAGASPSPSGSPAPADSPAITILPSPVISTVPFAPGPLQSNSAESVPVPAGWSVNSQDSSTIILNDPSGYGSVTVGSGASNPRRTAEQYRDSIDAYFQARYADTNPCPNSTLTGGTLNGATGSFWVLCFTMTAGGQSFPAASAMFAGANSSGTVHYFVSVLTSQDNLSSFVDEAKPVVQGIRWNLLK